jgi:uncharacterized protein YigE (DUF2233 family)
MRGLLFAVLIGLLPGMAAAVDCREVTFEGVGFTLCEVDLTHEDLRLFLRDDAGDILGQFSRVEASLPPGQQLGFATNGGMFREDRRPVGLYIEDGEQEHGLITAASPGNFGMLPNGVFCIMAGRAQVIESTAYLRDTPNCRDATQSGPMLVIDGALHPRFRENSNSRNIRNGVGVDATGTRAFFAISNSSVNFHLFARFFRDYLGVGNALYLDGRVSRLYSRDLGRRDYGFWLGPILGTVVDEADPSQ